MSSSDGFENSSTSEDLAKKNPKKKTVEDFSIGDEIGQGSYSTVYLANEKSNGKVYAIKVLDKKHIIKEKKVKYVNIEKNVLNKVNHPLIIKLYYTFQDSSSLYFVLDFAKNGELLDFIKKNSSFDEASTKFYAAEILLAIEYLHNLNIIHRDIKPENILMDENMHIKLTDFGTAKMLDEEKSEDGQPAERANSFVGTAEYVSPELLKEKSACKASDLWALGCIIYQLLAGRPPFKGGNEYQTFQKITKLEYSFPDGFPALAKDLVSKLLVLNPTERLGSGEKGIDEIKKHPFFDGIDWSSLTSQTPPKIQPNLSPNLQVPVQKSSLQVSSPTSETKDRRSQDYSKWSNFLLPNEVIVKMGLVHKYKGLFYRKRQLILTDLPRLIYIDEEKMVQKGEIPWNNIRPEVKNSSAFFVHTPNRTYYLHDPNGDPDGWVQSILKVLNNPTRKRPL